MIVNYKDNGWEVITQRSHGILAAQIAMQWKVKERPQRWTETVMAIAEHDDAEVELDGENLLTETGGPLNFAMKKFDLAHCRELSTLTISKSRYIALLTSLHMDFLYRKEVAENEAAKVFLKEQQKLREGWRKELGMTAEELKKIYTLLEWCDALSLLLCQGQLQPEKRATEISTGPGGVLHHLSQVGETDLTIQPWPFEAKSFDLYFEYRIISQLQFKNNAEFRAAFLAAPVAETVWKMSKTAATKKRPAKV
jgi:hypothetical protein